MRREDANLIGKLSQPLQRSVLKAGELLGEFVAKQVGAPGGADQQAAATEHGSGLFVDEHEVRHVLRRVSGRV